MKRPIKVLEICIAGTNSVLGGIYETLKNNVVNMKDYCWIILANSNSFDMLEDECKNLKLEEYIIADRQSMRIKNSK